METCAVPWVICVLSLLGSPVASSSAVASSVVKFSVSGHSSGGAMASQHFFAFSDRIYGMGQLESCAAYDLNSAKQAAAKGDIAAVSNIAKAQVYAMQGGFLSCPAGRPCKCSVEGDTCDTCGCCCAHTAAGIYTQLGANVSFKLVPHAHHGFVTDRTDLTGLAGCDPTVCVPCGDKNRSGDGMVQECGYDMAGALLSHLLGPLKPHTAANATRLIRFNQSKFWPPRSGACNVSCSASGVCPCTGMFFDGLVYIPQQCRVADIPPPNLCGQGCDPHNKSANPPPVAAGPVRNCRVHVVYPGCGCCINEGAAGYGIARFAGFNEWAESNNVIVLYPQQDGGGLPSPCWNALKDPNASNRKGLQMNVVNRIVDWLGAS